MRLAASAMWRARSDGSMSGGTHSSSSATALRACPTLTPANARPRPAVTTTAPSAFACFAISPSLPPQQRKNEAGVAKPIERRAAQEREPERRRGHAVDVLYERTSFGWRHACLLETLRKAAAWVQTALAGRHAHL